MDFIADYPRLEAAVKQRFEEVVTRLLAGEVLTPGSPLKPDPDWRFAERYRELIDSYLRFGGWRLDIDLGLRIARAVHVAATQRVRFSKLESLLLCALRLHYHEEMRMATDEYRCEIAAGALRERLVTAGKPVAQLSPRLMAAALRKLARHSLVQVARGFEARDDEPIVVCPLIEKVLPPERIQELASRVREYMSAHAPEPENTETNETEEEPEV